MRYRKPNDLTDAALDEVAAAGGAHEWIDIQDISQNLTRPIKTGIATGEIEMTWKLEDGRG
jgi:hypothetical protein